MRGSLTPLWRSLYRPDPLAGFLLLFGTADAILGSASGHWSLFGFGSLTVFLALVRRWGPGQKAPRRVLSRPPRAYLPPASSPPPLPRLSHDPQRSSAP